MNYSKEILSELYRVFFLLIFILISPIISLLWAPSEYKEMLNFIEPVVLILIIQIIIKNFFVIEFQRKLPKIEKIKLVVYTWFLANVFLALPFVFSGTFTFSQAFFETASGLSTTGLSVLTPEQYANLDKIYFIYRSLLQFFGGIGIILVLITIFSDSLGVELYKTEGHTDKLNPNAKSSARAIVKIYVFFIMMGFITLTILGMPSFDAFNTAICAVATGGFGVTAEGIAGYHSISFEIVLMILMLLGSFSFYTNLLICKGKFKKVFRIDEFKLFLKFIFLFITSATFIMTIIHFHRGLPINFFHSLEISSFETISAISGTGFSITDYTAIIPSQEILLFLVVIAMVIGGAIGSTAGGIKITRINILFKSLSWNIKKIYYPETKLIDRSTITPTGKEKIHDENVIYAQNYILLYVLILIVGTAILTAFGFSLKNSLFEYASALGNVGITSGITAQIRENNFLLWFFSITMFIGRLEIFVVLGVILNYWQSMKKFIINKK